MKSIERRFKDIQKRHQFWSSYSCFVETINGGSFSEQTIRRWLKKLVGKEDYEQTDKKSVLHNLLHSTKDLEDDRKLE
jgi:hypothetical protein